MRRIPIVFVVALPLVACSGDDSGGFGQLSLGVTDAPVDDALRVVVEFTGVEVKPQDGEALQFDFDEARTIDLLALHGGGSELLLDTVTLPSGGYNWIRLKVNAEEDGTLDSFIELEDGSQHELEVPSGAQSGLKLVSGFVVPNGGAAAFTIDFDLRKSVHEPMNEADSYKLRPALRLLDNAEVGSLAGTVDMTLIPEGCSPAVYLFSGAGAETDDIDGSSPEPVTTALVQMDDETGAFEYRAAFLAAGDYTAAYTCMAAMDDPETDDDVIFEPVADVTVVAGEETTQDFSPIP